MGYTQTYEDIGEGILITDWGNHRRLFIDKVRFGPELAGLVD